MKIKIPLFILGLLVLLTSYSGMTASIETFLFTTYGVIILFFSFKFDIKSLYSKPVTFDDTKEAENDDEDVYENEDENDEGNEDNNEGEEGEKINNNKNDEEEE